MRHLALSSLLLLAPGVVVAQPLEPVLRDRLTDTRPHVSRAATHQAMLLHDQDAPSCAALSAALPEMSHDDVRVVLRGARHECLRTAALDIARVPELSRDAQLALARLLPSMSQREASVMILVTRGHDATVLATHLRATPSIKLVTALQILAQSDDPGRLEAARVLTLWGIEIDAEEETEAEDLESLENTNTVAKSSGWVKATSGMSLTPSLSVGRQWLLGRSPGQLDERTSVWLGAKFYPFVKDVSPILNFGASIEFNDATFHVVPTLRVGLGYLTEEHDSYALQMLPVAEAYVILGAYVPQGGTLSTVRTGVGISSPLGGLLALTALAYEVPLPNSIELVRDTNLADGSHDLFLNFSLGF